VEERESGAEPLPETGGRLVANIMHFARVLRAAGLPIGPGKVLDAVAATRAVGLGSREDFYWTLHAVFVNRADQRELFDQAFHVFWRNPRMLERMMQLLLPEIRVPERAPGRTLSRRLAEALAPPRAGAEPPAAQPPELELDAALTASPRERLQRRDFEKMSAAEVAEAKAAIAKMRLPAAERPTRRYRPDPRQGPIDMRASLRASLRAGSGVVPLVRRRRRTRPPPLVLVCDISGSMSRYSRMLLHFAHTLANQRERVHAFVFGTRLTNVTRHLRERDVDLALESVSAAVEDWSGGTRIGHCLHLFNRDWSRRVLGQGAVVLLITDGLDRDAGSGLEQEMERLHKSCRRLIWLNPLLRYRGFEPRSLGMQAILPHADDLRAVHNLDSLTDLARALGRPGPRREEGTSLWQSSA